MRLTLLGFLCFSATINSYTQYIRIVDKTDIHPIQGAIITNDSNKIKLLTDAKGMVDISAIPSNSKLKIQYLGYNEISLKPVSGRRNDTTIMMNESSISLDEVVVSASRFAEKRKDVAQSIQVIKSKDLTQMNQSNTADVIQNTGSILVQKSQFGGGSPIVRGFETNKVLLVIDGVRMNNAIYRSGHLQNILSIDNASLEKVEIVFGPGSVVYGSDALGGVMHFYTKSPVFSTDSQTRIFSNSYVRYASVCNENSVHTDFNIGFNRFASMSSFSYSSFGDLLQGANGKPDVNIWDRSFYSERINGKDTMLVNKNPNLQLKSGYKQYDIMQKFAFAQNEKLLHQLNFQYSTTSDISRYDRLTTINSATGLPSKAQWYYGPQDRMFASYKLDYSQRNLFFDNSKLIAAYQLVEESRHDRTFGKQWLNHRFENVNIYSINADFEKVIGNHELRYGIEAAYNSVNSTANTENIVTSEHKTLDTRYPDGGSTMNTHAVYLTHTWEISPKFIINDGIRLSNVQLKSTFDDTTFFPFPFKSVKQNNTAVNGNLGAIYQLPDGLRLTGSCASGFRAPNVDDLSKVFESVPGNLIIPNPNLKPEYTYNFETGISKTFKNIITIGTTGYYTLLRNVITTQFTQLNGQDSIFYSGQLSRVTTNKNAGKAYIYGVEAYFSAAITRYLTIMSRINYNYGRIETDTIAYPLDHIPPFFGKTSFTLYLNKFKSEFYVMYNGAKEVKDYNMIGEDNFGYATPEGMPAWYTLNLNSTYSVNKNVQFQFAIENILNKNYRVFASNISAPGRNIVITVRGYF